MLPVGTVLSGVLTWLLFGNLYGAVVFVGLFIVGAVTENIRQKRAKARRAEADAAMGNYISRLRDAARDSGVHLSAPPWEDVELAASKSLGHSDSYRRAELSSSSSRRRAIGVAAGRSPPAMTRRVIGVSAWNNLSTAESSRAPNALSARVSVRSSM